MKYKSSLAWRNEEREFIDDILVEYTKCKFVKNADYLNTYGKITEFLIDFQFLLTLGEVIYCKLLPLSFLIEQGCRKNFLFLSALEQMWTLKEKNF
jgi:hypothetical protein